MKKVLLFLSLFLFVSTSAWAGIKDEYKKSRELEDMARQNNVEAMKKLLTYLGDRRPILRDGAYEGIVESVTDPQAIQFLAQALTRNRSEIARINLAEILGRIGKHNKDMATKALLYTLKKEKRSLDVLVEVARALRRLKPKSAARELERAYRRFSSSKLWLLRGECLGALVAIKGIDGASRFIKKGLKDRDYRVQGYALYLLKEHDIKKGLKEAIDILKKTRPRKIRLKGWQPTFVAFQVAVKAAEKKSVNLSDLKKAITEIINLLKGLKGRIFYNAIQALEKITGQKGIIPKYDDWKKWWEVAKSNFKPPSQKKEDDKVRRPSTVVRYHGIPIYSNRIVFAVDHSGSMRFKLKNGEGKNKGKIKFVVCQQELIKTLKRIDKEVYFNIFFLETEVVHWQKRLTKGTRYNRAKAIKYVSSVSPTRGIKNSYPRGNFFDAMKDAMMDPYADTMFLLSDGGPSAGRYTDKKRIKTHIRELNKFLHFEVHTILFGASSSSHKGFMRKLANMTGGNFHDKSK